MSWFLNTLAVCAGVSVAYVLFQGLKFLWIFMVRFVTSWARNREEEKYLRARKEKLEDQERRRKDSKKARAELVRRYLESKEVRDVVVKLVDHPYKDGYSQRAAANNKKRNRLLATLRKLVDNAAVREDLYTEPAKWVFDESGNPSC